MHPLIGFLGYAQVGKDTACQQLGWKRLAIADAMKADLEPLIRAMGLDPVRDKERVRALWVEYGRLGRSIDPNYWINKLIIPDEPTAITDVRYLSEVWWILEHGGMIVHIKRPGFQPANDEERNSFSAINMAVNTDQIPAIQVVINDSTIEAIGDRVRDAIKSYCRQTFLNDPKRVDEFVEAVRRG